MTIAGKHVNFQRVHGRQFVKKEGGDWIEYQCVRHNVSKKRIDIRVTDTIPAEEQFNRVAEEVLMLMKPKRQPKKKRKGGAK